MMGLVLARMYKVFHPGSYTYAYKASVMYSICAVGCQLRDAEY